MTETAVQPARGWRGRRVRLILIFGFLLVLLGYTGLDLWAGHKAHIEIARLEKRFGSLDEVTLVAPPVPAGDNRARIVRAAAALTVLDRPTAGRSGLHDSIYYQLILEAPAPVPAGLRAFVEANRAALRAAEDALTRRQSSWEVDSRGEGDQPPWMDIRVLSKAIYLAARLDLEAGRPDEAAKAIASGLAVSSSIPVEPGVIADLWQAALGIQQFEALQRLVVQSEPSKASLEELARWLVENRTPDPNARRLGELKRANAALKRMENGQVWGTTYAALRDIHNGFPQAPPLWLGPLARIGRPFIRLARVRCLQQMEHLLDLQAGPRPRPAFPSSSVPPRLALMRRLEREFTEGIEGSIEIGDFFRSELGATELAVALRRFRLDHGNYPDELSTLVPLYVTNLPIDPFTGRPPVYAREGAGFRLRAQGGKNGSGLMMSALDWNVPK